MQVLRPNIVAVAAKVIDGEAIIMNLLTGAYYSMDKAGAAVWEMIELGLSAEEIQRGIEGRYASAGTPVRADVERLLNELLSEALVVQVEESRSPSAAPSQVSGEPYQSPVLNKYTEMADLLALDPPMPAIGKLPADSDRA